MLQVRVKHTYYMRCSVCHLTNNETFFLLLVPGIPVSACWCMQSLMSLYMNTPQLPQPWSIRPSQPPPALRCIHTYSDVHTYHCSSTLPCLSFISERYNKMPVTPSASMSRNHERERAFSCFGNSYFSRDSLFLIDLSSALRKWMKIEEK
jgi:hypothetical protein